MLIFVKLQGCFSILSGFTIAAFLRIDVSNIPPEAYPFIVLVVGLENMSESACFFVVVSNLLLGFDSLMKWRKRLSESNQCLGLLLRSEPWAIYH